MAGQTGRWRQVHCCSRSQPSCGVPVHCMSKKPGWESQTVLLKTLRGGQGLGVCLRFLQSPSEGFSKYSSSQGWDGTCYVCLRILAQFWSLGTYVPPWPSHTAA